MNSRLLAPLVFDGALGPALTNIGLGAVHVSAGALNREYLLRRCWLRTLAESHIYASGTCRVAVLLARHGRTDDARDHLSRMLLDLGTRTDAAADNGRRMVDRTQAWLEARNS